MIRPLFLVSFFVSLCSWAQPVGFDHVDPEEVGLSSDRLERIDYLLEDAIKENRIPGAVALVMRKGKIAYLKSFGQRSESTSKLRTDDIFRIASQTKAITATAIMMLWEEGHFGLEDPISKWIPGFAQPKILDSLYADGSYTTIPADKEITIRHLLTHTSGIGYGKIDADPRFTTIYEGAGITDLFTTRQVTIEQSVTRLTGLPLHHHPGERFTYSEGLDVLGYLIEIISGQSLDAFFAARIFGPLGMRDTYFYLPESKKERLVEVLTLKENEWVEYPDTFYKTDYPVTGAKSFFSGGAGLSSTAEDYAKFLQMYLNEGQLNGIRLLSRKTVELIMSNQFEDLWPNDGKYYGLAFSIVNEEGVKQGGLGSQGTFDWGGYFNTKYFADPEEDILGILLKQTQNIDSDNTTVVFQQLVFQSIID